MALAESVWLFRELGREPFGEQVCQHRNFVAALAKRRHLNRNHVEPVKQVLSEAILADRFFKVAVRREDDRTSTLTG